MACRWIVSGYRFVEHNSLTTAAKERERLQAEHPKQQFHVYRIKTTLKESQSRRIIAGLNKRIRDLEDVIRRNVDVMTIDQPTAAIVIPILEREAA